MRAINSILILFLALITSSQVLANPKALSYEDFIHIVENHHPEIKLAKLEQSNAKFKRLEQEGLLDYSINSKTAYQKFNSSSEPGVEQEALTSDSSLDFITKEGLKFSLGNKYAFGDIKTPISPTGEAGEYYLRLQLPLLKDLIYNSSNVKIKTAKYNEISADFIFFRNRLRIFDQATNAYWDWVLANKILEIETETQKLLEEQVYFVNEQSEAGNLAYITTIEAERELQSRIGKVRQAERNLQLSKINLNRFLWSEDLIELKVDNNFQIPETIPEPFAPKPNNLSTIQETAISNRPEFKVLSISKDISILDYKAARNQLLPRLDAYITQGLETGDNSIGPTNEIGINFSMPIRRRSAKAQLEQAKIKLDQLTIQEKQLLRNIELEIEDLISQFETNYLRYLAAKQEYKLSQDLEEGEKEIFLQGDSTLFVVLRRQRDRVSAGIELTKTLAEYYKSKARLELATGSLDFKIQER